MKLIEGSQNFSSAGKRSSVALGNFDGVHKGHSIVLARAITEARKNDLQSIVYTFDPHPVKLKRSSSRPFLIQTNEQRLSALESSGIDICIIENFTPEFASMSPQFFFDEIICKRLSPSAIVVGYDFSFGHHKSGNTEELKRLCTEKSIELYTIEAQYEGEELISSTSIRLAIQEGEIEFATRLLGRPYEIMGKIVAGRGMGAKLGARTANLAASNELIPRDGVYLTLATIDAASNEIPAITSIGHNPTFHSAPFTIETHLLKSIDGELPGRSLSIKFLKRTRDQIAFASQDELMEQIKKDIEAAKEYHEARG